MNTIEITSRFGSAEPDYYHPPTPDMLDKGTLATYISYMRKFPVPTSEQEQILFRNFRDGKSLQTVTSELNSTFTTDEEAAKFEEAGAISKGVRSLIINCNSAMVVAIARKYYGVPLMERVQEGTIGLILAVDSFDVDNGSGFYGFAFPRIKGAIINARYNAKLVSFPQRIEMAIDRGAYFYRNFLETNQNPMTIEELTVAIAKSCRLSQKQALEAAEIVISGTTVPISLDKPYGRHDGSQGNSASNLQTFGDTLPNKSGGFEDAVISRIDAQRAVPDMPEDLTPREREIIMARFDLNGSGTNVIASDMAKKLNRTRTRILQIQREAFRRIREDEKYKKLA
jgi:RNA polymerase primary sigma factor